MAVSGTTSQTVFSTQQVIDHAFRRCKLVPQQITPEYIDAALDLLYLILSTLCSKGIALWRIEKIILPLYTAVQSVPCPVGTVDMLNANLRNLQRATGTASASEGDADFAFDSDLETACTQTTPGGYIQEEFESATAISNYGILPNATGSWDITIQVSEDGVTYRTVYANTAFAAVAGEWQWFDLEGQIPVNFIKLQAGMTTTLDVTEFFTGNMPNEIPLYKMNRDDYSNLSNKFFGGRPTQFWYNKQRTQPIMELWPSPQEQYTFYQIVAYVQKYIQDVGTMTQELDIPQRWYLAIVCELARQLGLEIKEVPGEMMPFLREEAESQLAIAWAGETDSSPAAFRPNLKPYTA